MHQLFEAFDGFAPAVTVLFPVAVLVGALSMTLRSYVWRTVSNLHDPLIDALLAYSAMAAGYLTFTPQPQIAGRVQLFLGDDLWMALRAAPGDAQPWVQLAGNLLLLLPMGALVPLRLPWFDTLGKIALGGLLAASTIEVTQLLWVSGRVASSDDIVLNTIGVTIGGLLVRGPWWESVPSRCPEVAARVVGPQHSVAAEQRHTVWHIISKIEGERGGSTSDYPTTDLPAVGGNYPTHEFPAVGKQIRREPARHP